jgi:TIR domain
MPPLKAIEILKKLVNDAGRLTGEAFESPKRDEWTTTARAALARSFATGSPVHSSFRAAQSISFNAGRTDEELRRTANDNLSTQVAVLASALEQLSWDVGENELANGGGANPPDGSLAIFISHSSQDKELADALIDLMRSALGLEANQIRCSSVNGYRLPVGVNTEEKLRKEVTAVPVVVGLITPSSLGSSYVMFELGARWGAELFVAPLLAGVEPGGLRGPLSLINALWATDESQLHQLLEDLSKRLALRLQSTSSYTKHVAAVRRLADSTSGSPSQAAATKDPVDARPAAAAEIFEITFGYLPDSPLNNGWTVSYQDSEAAPSYTSPVDPPGNGGLSIEVERKFAISYSLPPSRQRANELDLAVKYGKGAMLHVAVNVTSKDRSLGDSVQIRILIGDIPPQRHDDYPKEYSVYVTPEQLGKGWVRMQLRLPELVAAAMGRMGWVYDSVRAVQLRGCISVSPIKFLSISKQ